MRLEKQAIAGFFSILKKHWLYLFLLLLTILILNGLILILPLIISEGIDNFSKTTFRIHSILMEFTTVALAIMLLNYLQHFLEVFISERVAKELRSLLSNKISEQDLQFIENMDPSVLLNNFTVDINAIKSFIGETFALIISSFLIIIGTSIILFLIQWKLAIWIVILVLFISIIFLRTLDKIEDLFKQSKSVIDKINRVIHENIKAAMLIRILNSQWVENMKFYSSNSSARNVESSIHRTYLKVFPLFPFTENIAILCVMTIGGYFVMLDTLSLGYFNALLSYSGLLLFNAIYVSSMINNISNVLISFKRVFSVGYSEVPHVDNEELDFKQKIEIRNVNVAIGGNPILKNISLNVYAGSTTIIVGPTGSGKTYLLYVLSGLLKPITGTVKYDGKDIVQNNFRLLASLIGFVFQESIVFNLSIRENIAFSDSVTDASIRKAVETAELLDFIKGLPYGLDTVLLERGANISGGQKQRLMLARALAVNPKILFLDDFVSRLDFKTSEKVLNNIRKNYPALTIVTISQKITKLQHYDQIVFLMNGEVIDVGKHENLLRRSIDYKQLFMSQQNVEKL